ncbi:cell adhesion molecule CEACAM6-like isoform X5 [Strix uralensis]|uniref:cell adhesion molecule CEACAM6-like isoform X5 n=1 Tax=Strix uralensis TaxID=36305 RepID=UPI003DA264AB
MNHRAPGPRRSPCGATVLTAALLLSCPSPARGQAPPFAIRQDPAAARAGGDVTFVLEPAPGRVLSCSWYRAPSTDLAFEIFTYFAEPDLGQLNGSAHTGRETGAADCSMCIRQLRLNDSGAYTVAVRQPASASASASLVVHELLTQPAVTPDNATVTENDTVTLSCRSPPGTETVAWLHDGAPVAAGGRLSLSPDNRTLTVRPVQRGDAGAYACQVSNAISANRSDDATITVVYGPDGVTVTPPGPLWLRLGSRLELLCAAAAAPPPLFAWARGNASLATGSRLRLDFGDPGQAGEYRCRATNPALGRAAEASVLLLQEEGEWERGGPGTGGHRPARRDPNAAGSGGGRPRSLAAGAPLFGGAPPPPPRSRQRGHRRHRLGDAAGAAAAGGRWVPALAPRRQVFCSHLSQPQRSQTQRRPPRGPGCRRCGQHGGGQVLDPDLQHPGGAGAPQRPPPRRWHRLLRGQAEIGAAAGSGPPAGPGVQGCPVWGRFEIKEATGGEILARCTRSPSHARVTRSTSRVPPPLVELSPSRPA